MWPRGFRKKKQYTADELVGCSCERDAEKIRTAIGQGQIIQIAPPDDGMTLGEVHPPGGGVIESWYYHRAVRVGRQIFDRMTGPVGMPEDQYLKLFTHGGVLVITVVAENES